MYQVYHFKRYLEDQTVNITGGGDQDITDGWYSALDLIYFIGNSLGDTGLYYDGSDNRIRSTTPGATYDYSQTAADLMGYTASSATLDGTKAPLSTWNPSEIGFKYGYDPDDEGEPIYDAKTIISMDGTPWCIASEAVPEDVFRLSLIDATDMTGEAALADFTATWRQVWRPDLGINFLWAKGDALSDLNLRYSDIGTANWIYKEYLIRDAMAVQQSRKIQFDTVSKYHAMELPLIYVGDGDPS